MANVKDAIQKTNIIYDDFFIYQALDKLIPVTENDFNNFNDTIYDKI